MGRKATGYQVAAIAFFLNGVALAQVEDGWRRIGNTVFDAGLASGAGGAVERVWFSPDGSTLYARTASGRVFRTDDFEGWKAAPGENPPAPAEGRAERRPEGAVALRGAPAGRDARVYAFGRHAYRSDDGGQTWMNLTAWRDQSLLGGAIFDLAVSPGRSDEVAIAASTGVWRSVDGGLSWSGLNEGLPNLPVRRLFAAPAGTRGVRASIAGAEDYGQSGVEWNPGERQFWRAADIPELAAEGALRLSLSAVLGAAVTAARRQGDWIYAATADRRLLASGDGGRSFRAFTLAPDAAVERIWVDRTDPRLALAALSRGPVRILKTQNGGAFWDDLTGDLPGAAYGVEADRGTGAVYAATEQGVFLAFTDLLRAAPGGASWTPLTAGLPAAPARDVLLDAPGYQLYVALDGYGVYAAAAPHRRRDPKILHAADGAERPAAPGALLSVAGLRVRQARIAGLPAPVLSASENESQILVPFEVRGDNLEVLLDGRLFGVPLRAVAPAIFLDKDGAPLVLDAEAGVVLDAMRPARSGARLQILASGLGAVRPEWPAGLAAPLDNPPQVVAPVRVYLDRTPVAVTRAVLAPGYVGFYLLEVEIPRLVNYGPAELYLESGGQQSNRVRVYIEP